MSVERPQRGSSPPASGGGEERWADALRQAQAELDELRDRHAQERLLLEVQYQQSISGGQPLPSLPHLLHDEPLSPTAAAEPALDSATLQQRCMQLEARLTVCTEELSALRQSNSRLLSSESKYRERADQLQSQLTLAHSSHHSQQQTRSQIAALTAELQSMEAQMQAMRGEVERREEEMRRVVGEVEERLRRKKDGWRREREELTRSYDERERTLQVLAAREVERKEEEAKKAEAELKEVSAKHRQEWQTKEEQLFRIKDENLALSTELEALRAEVAKSGQWQSERSRLEAEVQRQAAAAARAQAELRDAKERLHEVKHEAAQQAEVSDVSERYIEQLKLEAKDKDDAIAHHSSQLSSLQASLHASQAAVQREQQQSLKALEVMQSELSGYREVHLSMVQLYDVQMQQMREQLQSVLVYVLDEEARAKEAAGGDRGAGISTRKVVDMMQLCMQQIHQQDLLIQAMSKQPHRPHIASAPPPPAGPARAVGRAAVAGKGQRKAGLADGKRPAAVEEAEMDAAKLASIPLTARISHLQLQLAHAQQQLASQRQRAAQQAQQAEHAVEDKQRMHERVQEMQRQLSHEKAEGKRRERELERAMKGVQQSQRAEAERSALARQVEDGQAALKAAKAELQRSAEQLQAALRLGNELRDAEQQAQAEVAKKDRQLERHHQSAQKHEAQLAELTQQLEELRVVQSRVREEGERRRVEADGIAGELSSAKEELARAEAMVKASQLSAEDSRRRVEEVTEECHQLQQRKEQHGDERKQWVWREEQLKRDVSTLESTLTETRAELRGVKGEGASLERCVEQLKAQELTLQRVIEEQRSTHSHLLHFLRELLQPHLLRLQSAYTSLHRQHQQRVTQRSLQRRRLEEERRQRQTQAGLDVSSVSAAASQAGLNLSMHEVEELMQASREVEGKSEEEEREEEELHRRNRLLQEVTTEWEAAFAAAAADAPRFSAAWSERLAHAARLVLNEEMRLGRMEGQPRPTATAAGDSRLPAHAVARGADSGELVLRYQQTVAERSHASQVARYQSRITDLLERLQRCRCGSDIRTPSTAPTPSQPASDGAAAPPPSI